MKRRSPSNSSGATLQKRTKPRSGVARVLWELRAQEVIFSDARDLGAYLRKHPRLARQLPAVCQRARAEFGPSSELELKVYRDPEILDRTLDLFIRLASYDSEFMDRIDRVSREFDEPLYRASGFLLLTSDFRPPRGVNGI